MLTLCRIHSSAIRLCIPRITVKPGSLLYSSGQRNDTIARYFGESSQHGNHFSQVKVKVGNLDNFSPKQIAVGTLTTDNMKFDTQLKVDNFIQDNLLEISSCDDIADLMQKSAKVSKNNRKRSYLQKHIPLIASRLMALSSVEWKFKDIARVFNGLRYMKITDDGVEDIMNVMTSITTRAITSSKKSLRSRDIATLLFGLQNMSSENKIIMEL
jgi:hypothetical protein